MDHINKLIYFALGAILFCAGVLLLVFNSNSYNEILINARNSYKDDGVVYQQYSAKDDEIIPYAELVVTILNGLDYNIRIDGSLLLKEDINRENIGFYGLRDINYKKSYEYDNNGNISCVVYTGM